MTSIEEYIEAYGYHFNKKLCDWAVSMMRDRNDAKMTPKTKEEVESFLQSNGVSVKNKKGWDLPYVHAMLFTDCWGSSYTTDKQLALGIKDFLDDRDGTESKAFDHFVVDCKAKREPIFWEDFM